MCLCFVSYFSAHITFMVHVFVLFLCFELGFLDILDEFFWVIEDHHLKKLLFCILCVITTIVVNIDVVVHNKNYIYIYI